MRVRLVGMESLKMPEVNSLLHGSKWFSFQRIPNNSFQKPEGRVGCEETWGKLILDIFRH